MPTAAEEEQSIFEVGVSMDELQVERDAKELAHQLVAEAEVYQKGLSKEDSGQDPTENELIQ